MKFDGFKVHSSDEHVTNLIHPKGHFVRVVHSALSKDAASKLKEIPHYYAGTPDGVEEDVPPVAAPAPESYGYDNGISHLLGLDEPNQEVGAPASQAPAAFNRYGYTPIAPTSEVPQPESALAKQPESASLGELSVPQSVAENATVQPGFNPLAGIEKAQKGIRSSVMNEANVAGEAGKAQADILQRNRDELQASAEGFQSKYDSLDQERESLKKDIMDGHIDPNRLVGNMTTAGKVSTAVGLILGGLSGGINKTSNPALEYLNKQIENDIGAQKANLGSKDSLLSANLRQFGNLKDAESMTRVHMMDLAKMELEKQAALSQDPMAKSRAQTQLAQMDLGIEQAMAPLRQKQMVIQGLNQGKIAPEVAIETIASTPKEKDELLKESAEYRGYSKAKNDLISSWNTVNEFNTVGYKVNNPREVISGARGQQLNASLAELNKQLAGRFNIDELKKLESQFSPATKDTDSDRQLKLKNLLNAFSNSQRLPNLKGHPELMNALSRETDSQSKYSDSGQNKIQMGAPVR
jgi:hypothetical protein